MVSDSLLSFGDGLSQSANRCVSGLAYSVLLANRLPSNEEEKAYLEP